MEKLNLLNYQKVEFTKLNEQFLLAKCYVLALGKNKNKSHFSKVNVDKAYSTLNFIPVVGHVLSDDNGRHYLGGHDVKLDLSDGFKLKSLCIPYGVAIPSLEPCYEDVTEEDGSTSTYLTTNIVLWTGRYPELEQSFYNNEIFCGQSMEILYSNAQPLEDDESYMDIIDFSFDALCMLGKSDDDRFNVEPCFPNARIESVFNLDKKLFDDFKNDLIAEFGSLEELKFQKEGGNGMDEKMELLSQYEVTVEQLNFDINELSVEELEEKLKEFATSDVKLEIENDVENQSIEIFEKEVTVEDESKKVCLEESKFTTYNEKKELIIKALPVGQCETDDDGYIIKETYVHMMDFDNEFVYVSEETWIPNAGYSTQYFKLGYTFDEENRTVSFTGSKDEIFRSWLTKEELDLIQSQKEEFEAYKETHSYLNEDYELLSEYKTNKEKEEFDANISEIVAKFEDVADKEEFVDLVKNKDKHSLASFEKECIYIRGLYATVKTSKSKKNFSAKESDLLKFEIIKNDDVSSETRYDYLKNKYLQK